MKLRTTLMENRTVLTSVIVGILVYVYSNGHAWELPWEDSATKEAQTAAEGAVYDRITKCEESYFLKVDDNNYIEIRGISMSVTPEEVTDVDKANGVEWKGGVLVAAKMYRTLQTFSDGKVSNGEWRDGSAGIPGFSGLTTFHDPSGEDRKLGFRKVNGQWSFNKKDTFGFFSGLPDKKHLAVAPSRRIHRARFRRERLQQLLVRKRERLNQHPHWQIEWREERWQPTKHQNQMRPH